MSLTPTEDSADSHNASGCPFSDARNDVHRFDGPFMFIEAPTFRDKSGRQLNSLTSNQQRTSVLKDVAALPV